MRKALLISTAALSLLSWTPGHTTDSPHMIHMYGVGALSCGTWSGDNRGLRATDVAWVEGYITGVQAAGAHMRKQSDAGGAFEGFIDKYCKDHPLNDIEDGAHALAVELAEP